MPDDSLQYFRELEALEVLTTSDELEEFSAAFSGAEKTLECLLQYIDQLCLHEWRIAAPEYKDDDTYGIERCRKCSAERERTSK